MYIYIYICIHCNLASIVVVCESSDRRVTRRLAHDHDAGQGDVHH